MIKAIIVDDEPAAINSLSWELQKFPEDIRILDTFTSAKEAISGINYLKPDCLFLDIEMPDINGFSLLQQLTYRNFALIMTTAYDQHALRAIKENAMDYLLKPIDEEDISKIVGKLKNLSITDGLQRQFEKTLTVLTQASAKKLVQFPVNGKILFAKIEDIIYCESDGNYTNIFMEQNRSLYVSKKLKGIEQLLPDSTFYRVHNSFIINMSKVTEYAKSEGYVLLSNQKSIPVSRIKKDGFLKKIADY